MITSYAFFFTSPEADPERDRIVIETGGSRSLLCAVPSVDVVPELARRAVADGVQLVELCGDFDTAATARVVEAVGPDVPVGSVRYGPEAVMALARISV